MPNRIEVQNTYGGHGDRFSEARYSKDSKLLFGQLWGISATTHAIMFNHLDRVDSAGFLVFSEPMSKPDPLKQIPASFGRYENFDT